MSDLEEKKYKLERWKVVLLTIAAFSTFLTFFIPFVNQREQQMDQAFSETLQRLTNVNPAVRVSGAIELVDLYHYQRFFRLGSSPYKSRCIFLLQNSLKIEGEEEFVRQAIIQALREIGPDATEFAQLKGADLSNLDLSGISFKGADFAGSNLSGATAIGSPLSISVSFENAFLSFADMKDIRFSQSSFRRAIIISADMSGSCLRQEDWDIERTDLRGATLVMTNLTNADWEGVNLEGAQIYEAILIGTNLSHTRLNGAIFGNITKWDQRTNFAGADCQGTQFDTSSDFYKWGQSKFPNCFK